MACRDLRTFLAKLEEMGELHRIGVEVDPVLEIAAITDRICKTSGGGTALLFERVRGSRYPVATNLFGSPLRLCAALGVNDFGGLTRQMEMLVASLDAASSSGPYDALGSSPLLGPYQPIMAGRGACQEVTERQPDLSVFPFLKNWPDDGLPASAGRFITLPVVITRDPETGCINCGMYRVELFDSVTGGIHWRDGSGGAGHYRKYLARGERMPVSVAIGGAPALTLAASLPLPENLNEMHLAGFLQQQPLELVAGLSNGLPVPATAEMIIEGFVTPGNMRTGGSFGNHTGAYVAGGMVPELQVTAITRRKRPVCAATVVGPPPMEDCWLAKAAERLLLPLLRRELPEIVDIHMPLEGIFHGCAIMAMKKEGSGHPRRVLDALWRRGWLRDARLLLLVDAEIGVADLSLVTWKVVNNVVWSRDLHIVAGRTTGHGERAGIDATGKRPVAHPSASEMAASPAIAQLIASRWREYGLE